MPRLELVATIAMAWGAAEQIVELSFDGSMNQYYGEVILGEAHEPHRVVFDTGSADIWLPAKHHNSEAGEGESFSITYESGDIETAAINDLFGLTADTQSEITLGECVGDHIAGMSMQAGIVGLGFPCLAHYTTPTLLEFVGVSNFTFNILAQDSAITFDTSVSEDTWEYAPLVTVAPGWELAGLPLSHISFWLVQLTSVSVQFASDPENDAEVISFPKASQAEMKKWPLQKPSMYGAHAIVDSGSNLLVVPKSLYQDLLEKMCINVDCIVPDTKIANPYCNECSEEDFPALEFRVRTTGDPNKEIVLVLEPEFYVDCRSGYGSKCSCDVKLTKQPSDTWGETWIFGANVMASFQPVFDVANSRVGFACTAKAPSPDYCAGRGAMHTCSSVMSLAAAVEDMKTVVPTIAPGVSEQTAAAMCFAAASMFAFSALAIFGVFSARRRNDARIPNTVQAADTEGVQSTPSVACL
jgi:hypothetical protein